MRAKLCGTYCSDRLVAGVSCCGIPQFQTPTHYTPFPSSLISRQKKLQKAHKELKDPNWINEFNLTLKELETVWTKMPHLSKVMTIKSANVTHWKHDENNRLHPMNAQKLSSICLFSTKTRIMVLKTNYDLLLLDWFDFYL